MKFLEEIAEVVVEKYGDRTDKIRIVFPNRRAGLFFRKYLAAKISNPIWSPEILSIEDFIKGLSGLQSADRLELIYQLYKVFTAVNKSMETFDKFYYWGNVLLQDFDEIDKFLVDPRVLFRNLAHVKKLEGDLQYLEEEQKSLILEFWKSFGDKLSRHQQGFLQIWDKLYRVYSEYREVLLSGDMAYDGMIYRKVAEDLKAGFLDSGSKRVIFAGFNALSKSEEEIIDWYVQQEKGEVYWDADDYYFKNSKQEAGRYLREMKFGNAALRNSFKKTYGNAFADTEKAIELISVASEVGQAQEASQILEELGAQVDEDTAIVLPNNSLLFPLLHALPQNISRLNITMGYPLASSSFYGLLMALLNLHLKGSEKGIYYFRDVLAVLKHPLLVRTQDPHVDSFIREIEEKNMLWVSRKMFEVKNELIRHFFGNTRQMGAFLIEAIRMIVDQSLEDVEKEFAYRFIQILNRLNEFDVVNQLKLNIEAFQKIFKQLVQLERLPFEGEPLLGLQVMGILETRNLDFKNVIVLSMNEGLIPPAPKSSSFIPHSIRKVFGLPVTDHQDAMYSYIFYRLIQRAEKIHFIYNATEETGKSGEVSRFVRQLEQETQIPFTRRNVSSIVTVEDARMISIEKNDEIMAKLYRYTSRQGYQKRFTPTAINTYLDCRLRFYYKYVLELYEQDEMAEEVDAMVFGNILHHVMEKLYRPFDRDGNRTVTEASIKQIRNGVDEAIKAEFARQFGAEKEDFVFEGQNVLAQEIIRKMVFKVLEYDQKQLPFDIIGVEADDQKGFQVEIELDVDGGTVHVGLKGIIDRIERKESHIRIVDYKTGKDEQSFEDLPSLFDRQNPRRNKAVLQTFLYGLLYQASSLHQSDLPVQASLFNIRDLFRSDFSPLIQVGKGNAKKELADIRLYLEEFTSELGSVFEEIFDPEVNFSQTEDEKKCSYCAYAGICKR